MTNLDDLATNDDEQVLLVEMLMVGHLRPCKRCPSSTGCAACDYSGWWVSASFWTSALPTYLKTLRTNLLHE